MDEDDLYLTVKEYIFYIKHTIIFKYLEHFSKKTRNYKQGGDI